MYWLKYQKCIFASFNLEKRIYMSSLAGIGAILCQLNGEMKVNVADFDNIRIFYLVISRDTIEIMASHSNLSRFHMQY